MFIALTTRRLKSGEWEGFRAAWEPKGEEFPPGFVRAVHARNVNDPDEIVSFGMFEASREDLVAWRERNDEAELRRHESMDRHVESTGTDAFFEVIDEVTPDR
jgi:hypothetical protein